VNAQPKTEDELLAVIRDAIAKGTDYNGSAEALSTCAVAAFMYAASVVGASGFQGEWAALRAYGEVMGIKGPFAVLRGEDLVYPQYDLRRKVEGYIDEWTPWAAEKARENLLGDLSHVHPEVLAHWRALAAEAVRRINSAVKP
jgi:hypothetical protein